MREIKFRAWDKTLKQWIKQPFAVRSLPLGIPNNEATGFFLQETAPNFEEIVGLWNGIGANILLMQFTGLHDKNGKEIYEGDVLSFAINKGRKIIEDYTLPLNIIAKVVFEKRSFGFRWWDAAIDIEQWNFLMEWKSPRLEVIGNIYENPELLNGGKE